MAFFSENISFSLPNEQVISQWICNAIAEEKKTATEITYVFCADDYLHNINLTYLNHDTYTDIITFDYTENNSISGDIFISIDRVEENAATYNKTFENELHRVIIHGVLHLLGYKDKTDEEADTMRAKEDFYLSLLSI
ncbi:MAG: rRNA maturation RNase YbeY [Vicingus serpentipes]|nr:rRNA maturation RNase YbeY [Vicingus serpentipes]